MWPIRAVVSAAPIAPFATRQQLASHLPRFFYEQGAQGRGVFAQLHHRGTMFEELASIYVGPIDGHNLDICCPC